MTGPWHLVGRATAHTVDGLLSRAAARVPDNVALRFEERSWTYRELDLAVTRGAAVLRAHGLTTGDRVATYGTNSDAYAIAFLAAARAGLVHVPINYALRGDELRYLLENSGARAILVDPALAESLDEVWNDVPAELTQPLRDSPGSLLEQIAADSSECGTGGDYSNVSDSDLVQLLYTSGTTSRPRGAMMTHRALVLEYLSCITSLDQHASDNPLICMPLYHSAAMHCHLMPYLTVGATITLLPTADIDGILDVVPARAIGSLFLAPTVWVPLANDPRFETADLSSLRKAYYGASIMPAPVLERLRRRYPKMGFYNGFGQSEIGPLATVLRPEDHAARPTSCGRPVLFVQFRVVDVDGNNVACGQPGEIVYRSPQLCSGYWADDAATAEAFRDGWFHSGDLVTQDERGYITVVDRIKDVINTGGVLVASREVEDVLYQHPAVSEVAVIGTPDPKWIEAVTAFIVVRKSAAAVTEEDLIAYVKQRLAGFKVPKSIHFIHRLPRNQSGKILKRQLRARVNEYRPADR